MRLLRERLIIALISSLGVSAQLVGKEKPKPNSPLKEVKPSVEENDFLAEGELSAPASAKVQATAPASAKPKASVQAPAPQPALSTKPQVPTQAAPMPVSDLSDKKESDIDGDPAVGSQVSKTMDSAQDGRDLVNMDFPELTDIRDIIKAVALWTGKNVILDRNVTGKIQLISPKKVTKDEAYQAFLSALNMLNLTTVETGRVIKIMKVRNAVKGNLKTYMGSSWAPRTDNIITQIIPLKYIEAKGVQSTLSRIVSSNAMVAYEPTNTLIISDSGYKVRRVLEILELLDVQTQQPKIEVIAIKHREAKSIADRVNELLKGEQKKGAYHTYKILTDDKANAVIIFGPPRTIQDVKELVEQFDTPLDDPSTQATIHVRPLDYADAKKLATTLSSLATASSPGANRPVARPIRPTKSDGQSDSTFASELSEGVKITADESSNSLLITGSRAAYNALNTIIRKLDVRRSQVFIEADILEIAEDNGFQWGLSIFGGAPAGGDNKLITGWEGAGIAPLIQSMASVSSSPTGAVSDKNLENVAKSFSSNLAVGVLMGKPVKVPGLGEVSPGALINLVKADQNTKVLASPHILTANNEESTIVVGETLMFPTSSVNATGTAIQKIEKENVDLNLTIKPNISRSNHVTLNIQLESSSVKGINAYNQLPELTKKKTKQQVTVKDGQTIVISGLTNTKKLESYKKVPLLGDIPIIGLPFRNTSIKHGRSNLVISLKVNVVHGASDLAAIYKAKTMERDEVLREIYGNGYKKDSFYKELPTLEDGAYKPTKLDEAEERRLEEEKKEIFRSVGYDGDADNQ